jgi:hypothetical protein
MIIRYLDGMIREQLIGCLSVPDYVWMYGWTLELLEADDNGVHNLTRNIIINSLPVKLASHYLV